MVNAILFLALAFGIVPRVLSETTEITQVDKTEKKLEIKKNTEGWSEWGEWSPCTKSCNGGVSHRLRKCNRRTGCGGDSIVYKICSMQHCEKQTDFRAAQCTAYDSTPYRNRLYTWLPFYDPADPCSLTCQAQSYNFVAKLASNVEDGTRCREGSLDMCVKGKCLPVGCDLKLGSNQKVDQCGVCGGDGSTCRKPLYAWSESQYSPCSVTCGGGYQMSRPICRNKETGKEIDEGYCNISHRPRPKIRECNLHKCPNKWITEEWTECSTTCGRGTQTRHVYCAKDGHNGTRIPISGDCHTLKPATERTCNIKDCPRWYEGPWSGCSTSCGQGFQRRVVICKDHTGETSDQCDSSKMPARRQLCNSGISCGDDTGKVSQEDSPPYLSPYWASKMNLPNFMKTHPSYVAGEWGPCSVTCGAGVRWRHVVCQIFLEFSRAIATLPDRECRGSRPMEVERCYTQPCSPDQNHLSGLNFIPDRNEIHVTYSWRMAGYTPCSASCLGGTRESIIQCIRDYDYAVVSPYMCDLDTKPPTNTQPCNEHPCPPRWNTTAYSPCSKTCGGGIQSRKVTCVHEKTHSSSGTQTVANNLCPQPPPLAQQYCNVFDCPPKWHLEPWSKCSKSCGGGNQTRKIKCQKEMAFGQTVELSPSECSLKRPRTVKPCNKKSCEDFIIEETTLDPDTKPMFIQEQPGRKVLLEAKGTAVLYQDTIVKLRCPGIDSANAVVMWYKNGKRLEPIGKYSVSRRGALKIRKISDDDAAVYTCVAGKTKSDINITIKPVSSTLGTSEKSLTTPAAPRTGGDYSHGYIHQDSSLQIHPPETENFSNERIDHDTWEYHQSQDIISDQNSREMDASTPYSDSGFDYSRIHHGSTITLPHVYQLITHLRQQQERNSFSTTSNINDDTYYSGRNGENLELDWMVTDWTPCSRSCGGNGFQVRAKQCLVRLQNVSKTVDNNLCLNNNMQPPPTIQRCGLEACPHWEAGLWSDCNEKHCYGWNTALQKRNIHCKTTNGTVVDPSKCNERLRPRRKRECFNERCRGTWKIGEWSQCTVTCGHQGFQTRTLQCVWYGTNKLAKNACQNLPRPTVIIPCEKPPCPHNDLCVDRAAYCDVVKRMNVCHLATYRQQCCYTCKNP
ncbi:LOW QUALITY PROTEIN: protein madd-4-like [Centruroides vittatus]|uniref:LOW QUALITY PROTEIN: protein madd-4-like n=1 Tax=Centruroides vittatus TaxID=120091 RepID=UPI00350F821C